MPRNSSNTGALLFPTLPRIAQQDMFSCGPATLQMLAGFKGYVLSQQQIIESVGIEYKIRDRGMFLPEMAESMRLLLPDLNFWYKREGTLRDLVLMLDRYQQPVAVEWQGLFDYDEDEDFGDDDDEEDEDDDPGHYAIITNISLAENRVMIADPDRHYIGHDRYFSIMDFDRRWWDLNDMPDPRTGRITQVEDYHVFYCLTRKDETFPLEVGMMCE